MSLDGKVAVVTGAAGGIGRASAVRLAQDGADVAVLDVNEAGLTETAAAITATGRRCVPVVVDLFERVAISEAFARVKRELGFIEILHNNAGGRLREGAQPFDTASAQQWDYVVDLNLRAVADCSREVVSEMKAERRGRIINTSSEQAYRGGPGFTEYAAAKAGLLGFTRSLALELAPYEVTVNAVCPGITRTAALDALPAGRLEASMAEVPMGRMVEPEEIAHAVSFFASPGAGFVTGEHLLVTGGRTLR